MRASLRVRDAVLDWELACLDDAGRRQFRDLLFGRGAPEITKDALVLRSHEPPEVPR